MVKSPRDAGRGPKAAQEPVRGGVEGPAVHLRGWLPDEALGAREHFLGGAAREGEQEDPLRRDAAVDQVGDAVDQRSRLSRSGAGDDEERSVSAIAAAACSGLSSAAMSRRDGS